MLTKSNEMPKVEKYETEGSFRSFLKSPGKGIIMQALNAKCRRGGCRFFAVVVAPNDPKPFKVNQSGKSIGESFWSQDSHSNKVE